jgi:predicted porin
MKKTMIVAAAAASFVPLAHAQSSVTLYGLIDAGFTYTNNVNGSGRAAVGSGIDQSRWGLRRSEDLGGGLKAIFNLESGFDASSQTTARCSIGRRTSACHARPPVGLDAGLRRTAYRNW